MKKKIAVLATENDLIVDLTFHNVPASLLAELPRKGILLKGFNSVLALTGIRYGMRL